MYSTYGYGSLLKLFVLPGFAMLQICVMLSTLHVYVGQSVMSIGTQYIYTILKFIILFGIIFCKTYMQHCQNILHLQKNPPH